MTLLYFAWVRQKIGQSEETMVLPAAIKDVNALITTLIARGAGYGDAFADLSRLRVAVNQRHCGFDTNIADGDEVAFFPPVTGG